jgi:hypothetical protein
MDVLNDDLCLTILCDDHWLPLFNNTVHTHHTTVERLRRDSDLTAPTNRARGTPTTIACMRTTTRSGSAAMLVKSR